MEKNTPLAKRQDDERHCYPEVARPDGDGPEHQKRRRGPDCSVAGELSERVQSLREEGKVSLSSTKCRASLALPGS